MDPLGIYVTPCTSAIQVGAPGSKAELRAVGSNVRAGRKAALTVRDKANLKGRKKQPAQERKLKIITNKNRKWNFCQNKE